MIDNEAIPSTDNFWLRLESPHNHMTISSVMILEKPIKLETLQQVIETRWCQYERFKQRPVHHTTGVYWETDGDFEIQNHVQRIGLPGQQGKNELEELVSNLVSTSMDPNKPLWDIHLIEHYQGGSAVVWRINHSYADGIALIQVVLSITDPTASIPSTAKLSSHTSPATTADNSGKARSSLLTSAKSIARQAIRHGQQLVESSINAALNPATTADNTRRGISMVLNYAQHGWEFVAEATQLMLLQDDPLTHFKGELGPRKRVAWTDPLALKDIRILSKALDCTMNDILLTAVAGALRAYLIAQGETIDSDLEIRAAVPVNLRSKQQVRQLGNYFGIVLLPLPIGIGNPLKRLTTIHQRMAKLKSSYQASMTLGLMELLGLGPAITEAWAMQLLTSKASAVMTNVPGPQKPLYFVGSHITEWMFWVPQSGSVGMGVSIITYNNQVQFGLISDRKRINDPALITRQFHEEVEKLLLMALMSPWETVPPKTKHPHTTPVISKSPR